MNGLTSTHSHLLEHLTITLRNFLRWHQPYSDYHLQPRQAGTSLTLPYTSHFYAIACQATLSRRTSYSSDNLTQGQAFYPSSFTASLYLNSASLIRTDQSRGSHCRQNQLTPDSRQEAISYPTTIHAIRRQRKASKTNITNPIKYEVL